MRRSYSRLMRLIASPNLSGDKLKSRALFIVARNDGTDGGLRLPGVRAQYERAFQPKELIVADGSAHANFFSKLIKSDLMLFPEASGKTE